jgi:hypothetical protein
MARLGDKKQDRAGDRPKDGAIPTTSAEEEPQRDILRSAWRLEELPMPFCPPDAVQSLVHAQAASPQLRPFGFFAEPPKPQPWATILSPEVQSLWRSNALGRKTAA